MSSSAEGICLVSDNESLLGWFPGPDSDKTNAAVPDEDANIRRTGAPDGEDAERLFKIPIGWSNLQLGPNLQIP